MQMTTMLLPGLPADHVAVSRVVDWGLLYPDSSPAHQVLSPRSVF